MFSVARLRRALAPLLLLAPALVHARDRVLFTSSVTYCEPPQSILVQQFDIAYYANNQSIVFNISAASVDPNTNVVANLFLNVYGMNPVNVSIDICSLFGGVLCPLPLYTFNGADSIPLPDSLDIASHLPSIAYTIPDIEAYAQLTLTDVDSGEVKACIQTTLSNGWSTHQYAVEWATASLALLTLALAIWQSVVDGPFALAPIRLIDLISLLQSIALSGLLALNYPSIYRSFTLNFAWAFGLFPATTTSPIQQSINRMRHLTGGAMSNASDNGVTSFVNRKLSPYNSANFALPLSLSSLQVDIATWPERFTNTFSNSSFSPQVLVGGDVATVTDDSSNVLEAGIPIYTNSIGIATANAFMTIFLIALILTAIVLGALGLAYGVLLALSRTEYGRTHPALANFRSQYPSFARAWGIRAALVCTMPILVFTFYQWTLKDSWLSVLLSVIILVVLGTIVLPSAFFAVRSSLPISKWTTEPTPSVAPFTAPYRPNRVYYVIPLLLVMIVKALVTAFGHAHGMVQVIFFVVLEFLLFISLVVLKPYRTRGADVFAGYLCITRLVCSGLMIAFAESLAVKPIPRVAIGAITAVIFSVAVVIMFFNLLVNMGLWRLFVYAVTCGRRGRRRAHAVLSSQPSDSSLGEKAGDLEKRDNKDNATVTTGPSQYFVSRPNNPSPPSTVPSTPLSATSSTTLGETLPRRWSFQHSRPPSVSTDAPHSPAYTHRTSTASSPISGQRHSRNISSSLPTPLEEHPYPHTHTPPHSHPLPPLPPSPHAHYEPYRAV
ncbi:TRP-domain-containing protein [Lentinus tigrinus ALCF2SS1-7]|uniref:TRP-domain-containing protein n=1 Tax=Lentinus tigrinus ALCF2SS1-7 TaxID=1328758 RepID=UPI001166338E|nr:TRP-domain-containing protein [Lentinus tigrinus ALCF2SS1-7]